MFEIFTDVPPASLREKRQFMLPTKVIGRDGGEEITQENVANKNILDTRDISFF